MRRIHAKLAGASIVILVVVGCAEGADYAGADLYAGFALVDPKAETVTSDAWIVVRDGLIVDIGSGPPPGVEFANVRELAGLFAMPGLIDAHAHITAGPQRVSTVDGEPRIEILSGDDYSRSNGAIAVIVLALATWVFIVAAWLAAILIDGWRMRKPAAMTTTAYLDFSIHRCRAGQRSIAAAFVLGVPFTAFMLIWTYYERNRIAALDVLAYVVSALVIALGAWRWRVLRRERQHLTLLRQEIADNPPSGPEERAGIFS